MRSLTRRRTVRLPSGERKILVFAVGAVSAVALWMFFAGRVPGTARARGRTEGIAMAERDIAAGRPFLRRLLHGWCYCDIGADGFGIDRTTGLPLQNTAPMCGTGVDVAAYDAEIESYNARIMETLEEGALERFRLGHKHDLVVVDDGTTAVVRARDGFTWVVDLPRRIVVQVTEVGFE